MVFGTERQLRTFLHAATFGALLFSLVLLLHGCGGEAEDTSESPEENTAQSESETSQNENSESESNEAQATPRMPEPLADDLEARLLVAYSPFSQSDSGAFTVPEPARLEIISRSGGEWQTEVIRDEDSNVFHKAIPFSLWGQEGIITIGGVAAAVKFWTRGGDSWNARTLWQEDFGGTTSRMRDAETVTVDGVTSLAIATHDQGMVALLTPASEAPASFSEAQGNIDGDFIHEGFTVRRSTPQPGRFVHEIEVGDLDGDGTPEVYATPSDPNHTRGGAQRGEVVRFSPQGEGVIETTIVADLGDRHAKEIFVADMDGDGKDELYVSVEGLKEGGELQTPVEVRRFVDGTAPDEGVVIGRIPGEELMRFLAAGDVDGDGKLEMVAASSAQGVWLLTPGTNHASEWGAESIDRDSSGFEHAAYFADLDDDGFDELYVSSDGNGEIRRYVWVGGRARRSIVTTRENPSSMITWNIVRY